MENIDYQVQFFEHYFPELDGFFDIEENFTLLEEYWSEVQRVTARLLTEQAEGRIDNDKYNLELEKHIRLARKKLDRAIRKHRRKLDRQTAVDAKIIQTVCFEITKPLVIGIHGVRKNGNASFSSIGYMFGFADSIDEFLGSPDIWLKGRSRSVRITKLPYPSLGTCVSFSEFEREALPQRVGSGETGLNVTLRLHPIVYDHLEKSLPCIDEHENGSRSCEHLVFISCECPFFPAPEIKIFEPEKAIPDKFVRRNPISSMNFQHFKTVKPDEDSLDGHVIEWAGQNFQKTKEWCSHEAGPEEQNASLESNGNRATDVIAKVIVWGALLSWLLLAVMLLA